MNLRASSKTAVGCPGFGLAAEVCCPAFRLSGALRRGGYLMAEALVYIGVVFIVLGVGFAALYVCIDHAVLLRRNAEDITRALGAGERWRADVRAARPGIKLENTAEGQVLRLEGTGRSVEYRYAGGAVFRRAGLGPWARVLDRVKASNMQSDERRGQAAWRWELELQPQTKGTLKPGRVRPLFTFLAVPHASSTP